MAHPTLHDAAAKPAELAKATLVRLAHRRLEPTPENYARIWAEVAGLPAPAPVVPAAAGRPGSAAAAPVALAERKAQGSAWSGVIERLARGLERGGRHWTAARRKESLQRVLDSSRHDAERLMQRLLSLVQVWEGDQTLDFTVWLGSGDAPAAEEGAAAAEAGPGPARSDDAGADMPAHAADAPADAAPPAPGAAEAALAELGATLLKALPADDARAAVLGAELRGWLEQSRAGGLGAAELRPLESLGGELQRWFGHRHELVDQLAALCRELTLGLTDLAEDESWVRGQCLQVQERLAEGLSRRALHAASEVLAHARAQQRRARDERAQARDALKHLLSQMISEVGELGQQAGGLESTVERHAQAIASAQSLEGLAGIVQSMLDDSRKAGAAMRVSRERLQQQHVQAGELEQRVQTLESELRRISEEANTDALTQVANRRGLEAAFATECARARRDGGAGLAVGLIDIDNFKRLNDRLGHAAGDLALKALASAVRDKLRPLDHVARFGGEEFVVLLPGLPREEAQRVLTRLQRELTASLFLHEGEEVFVTFSGGVTSWKDPETLAAVIERADLALYEAKRSGKNRTCVA